MSESGWRCVVFDLDGTIANTIPLIIASYDHAMSVILGVRPDPDEARGWIGQTLYDTFHSRYPEQATELIEAYVDYNLAELPRLLERYPGVPELLVDLSASGVTTGVATSKRRASAELTVLHAGLEGKIPLTVTMEDTPSHKPHPQPLRLALTRLGATAAEAVYVGDAVVDVEAAQAAGLAQIAVTWGAGRRDELLAAEPTALVDTVEELRALLLG
jgi:pyrophosphatase PpaX